jgi:hypothetical protein
MVPNMFVKLLTTWRKRAKTMVDDSWQYLDVEKLVTVACKRFLELVGVYKPNTKN